MFTGLLTRSTREYYEQELRRQSPSATAARDKSLARKRALRWSSVAAPQPFEKSEQIA